MNILCACEEAQAVTIELRKLGHNAFSCDLQPQSGGHDEWHIMSDVLELINGDCGFETCDGVAHKQIGKWDMIIAFPPCTHLAVSGAKHFKEKIKNGTQQKAIDFFMKFVTCDCDRIAIENPIGIMSSKYRKPDQIINPWMFGDPVQKNTCLWLIGLPMLIAETKEKPEIRYHIWYDKKSGAEKRVTEWFYNNRCLNHKDRAKQASKTFPGIAKAMAEQWTDPNASFPPHMKLIKNLRM